MPDLNGGSQRVGGCIHVQRSIIAAPAITELTTAYRWLQCGLHRRHRCGGPVVLVVLIALAVKLALRAARKSRADMTANKVMTDQTSVVVTKADAVGANASAPDVKPTPTAAERL